MRRDQLARFTPRDIRNGYWQEPVGRARTGPSFTVLLAPIKNLVGVEGMPPRQMRYRRPGSRVSSTIRRSTGLRRLSSSLAVSIVIYSEVSGFSLVHTCHCAYNRDSGASGGSGSARSEANRQPPRQVTLCVRVASF